MAKIQVTRRGLVGDGHTDNSQALGELIASVPDNSTVVFPKGDYFFASRVTVNGKKHLTIEGQDATLITHFSPCGPRSENNNLMSFDHCDDLIVRDFIVTTDNPIGCAGRVTAVDLENRTFDVRVFDEFPLTGEEHFYGSNSCDDDGSPDYVIAAYEPITEKKVTAPDGSEHTVIVGTVYDLMENNTIRVHARDWEAIDRLRIGHLIEYRYFIYGNTHFEFSNCNRVEMKNIEIYRATSMGAVIHPRCSDFTFDHFNIRVRPGSREVYAANADGIHIIGLTGHLRMKHCHFVGLGDDALNIHGSAGEIADILPDGRVKVQRHYFQKQGLFPIGDDWAMPGDVLEVYDSHTFLAKGTLTVGSFVDGVATVTASTGTYATGDALANTAYFAATHVSDCVVKNTRARGLLLQTHNVLVENCYFFGMSGAALLLSPDIKVWFEVGPSENVVIRNNVIEKCAFTARNGLKAGILMKGCHDAGAEDYPAGVHRNIRIIGNTFRRMGGYACYLSAIDGLEMRDNLFEDCCNRRARPLTYMNRHDVFLRNCDHVTLAGNRTTRKETNLIYMNNCKKVMRT